MIGIAGRLGLWLGSLLLAVALFSLLTLPLFAGPGFRSAALPYSLRITAILALPAWIAFSPFVVAIRNLDGWRPWVLLTAGVLMGPVSLLVESAFGMAIDPLAGGLNLFLMFALVVGSLATVCYLMALKLIYPRFFARTS